VRLCKWVRRQGVSYQTAWRWVENGTTPVPVHRAPSGTWLFDEGSAAAQGRVVARCRVCARLYGRRAAKNRADRAVAVATGEAAG